MPPLMIAANVAIGLVALIHVYFALLETVLFRTRGARVFGLTPEKVEIMAPAMSNQGVYNLFLAAALVLGLVWPDPAIRTAFVLYGLGCVIVAGIWGGITVKRVILFIQALPAVIAINLYLFATGLIG